MKYDELVDYYDRELGYLRRAGQEFARRYPKIAQRLELQANGSADPHVERLIESFAFLTARIQRKLDDEFPELTAALLSVIYPHFLAPVPSLSILQLHLDTAQGRGTDRTLIPRGAPVFSRPIDGNPCIFQTCYDVELWPLSVSGAQVGTPKLETSAGTRATSALYLDLRCADGHRFSELSIDKLRFYLHGAARQVYSLYEYLLNQVTRVELFDPAKPGSPLLSMSAKQCIQPVGFEPEQGLLPYGARSLLGYRLLLEYFVFPQKFLFFDLLGLEPVVRALQGRDLRIAFYADQPYPGSAESVDGSMFQLGCSPIVNIFRKTAERLPVKHTHYEYCVVPDRFRQRTMEVYEIESVRGLSRADTEQIEYKPFYSVSHSDRLDQRQRAYWYANRRPLRDSREGTDVYLSFVDLRFDAVQPMSEVLVIDALCTNRDLPSKLPFGEARGDFSIENYPVSTTMCLTKPTPVRRIALQRGLQWRLISHLALNHASLTDPVHGRDNLLEVLRLYDFHETDTTEQQISGILSVQSRSLAARIVSETGEDAVARGFDVTIEFDPEHYVGSSVYLFASVIERFLGLHVAMNSFCRLTAKLRGKEGYLKRWKPRAGSQCLL